MKYLREILLCVVLTAACSVATLHGGDSLSLKIMTYNLRFGEKASLEELAEARSGPIWSLFRRSTAAPGGRASSASTTKTS